MKKTEQDIAVLVSHEIRLARNYDTQDLSEKRQRAINYYYGVMDDTPPEPNGSKVVSKDVSEVIGWMLPGIMRVFMASGRIAEYEPASQKDEPFAEQASDYVQYLFTRRNDGYRILYNCTHDALLQGDGVIKHWWDASPDETVTTHSGLDDMSLTNLVMQPGVEILAHTLEEDGTNTIKIKTTKSTGRVRIEACKPESLLTNPDAITLDLKNDDCRFVAQHEEVTRSRLIEMGFDKSKVANLGDAGTSIADKEEDLARDHERSRMDDAKDDSLARVDLYECYFKADIDGDGMAEVVRAYYAGKGDAGTLLDWEEWEDDLPFTLIPCEPVPHRIDSLSAADQLVDIQQIKTVLFRNMLNNVYAVAHPSREVEEGSVLNMDALVNPKHGNPLFKKKGSAPIQVHEIPFVSDKLLLAIQHIDQVTERRTGVSRSTMALDPDALQNQTATAIQKATDAAYSKIELIARNMAELGWRKVFRAILRLVVKHQDRPEVIRLRDKWVEMDPRAWSADMDCTVNVGLGTGSRDRDMVMLNTVLTAQERLAASSMQMGFPQIAIEMLPKIIKTLVKQAESAGLRNGDEFYPSFDEAKLGQMMQIASQPKEDPKIAVEREKAQIDMQAKQAGLQLEAQKSAMEAEREAAKMRQEAELAREKMLNDVALNREQADAEIALKERQLASEMALEERRIAGELQLERELGVHSANVNASAKVATSQVKMGGDAG